MTFKDYLTDKKLTLADAAKALNVTHQACRYWASGDRVPRPKQMQKIIKWSNGRVTPADFYGAS